MTAPIDPQHGTTFDLAAVEREARADPAYQRGGHTARTLVRTTELRVVLIAIRAGARIDEHSAAATTTIQTLAGRVRIALPERPVELGAGELLALAGGLRHDVEAIVDSALLLTLGVHPG